MKTVVTILILLFIFSNSKGQQDTIFEPVYFMYQDPIPRFSEKELFKDIKRLFKSKDIEESNIYIYLLVSNLGKTIDLRVSEDISFNDELINIFSKYNSWIAGKNFYKYASIPITYQIECHNNRIKIYRSKYYGPRHKERIKEFLLYEGIITKSYNKIEPFNKYMLRTYLIDSLSNKIYTAYVYRPENLKRQIKISFDPVSFNAKDAIVFIYNDSDNRLIEKTQDINYIHLPRNSVIEILAIRAKLGLVYDGDFVLTEDLFLEADWEPKSYYDIATRIENWK